MSGPPFTKRDPSAPAGFFAAEAAGLDWLRETETVAVPRAFEVAADHISLERIATGPWTPSADERFGRELAALHRSGVATFGWAEHPAGFIGPLPQSNEPVFPTAPSGPPEGALSGPPGGAGSGRPESRRTSGGGGAVRGAESAGGWAEFYWLRRVEPFVRQAGLPAGPFDRLAARLDQIAGPPESPARIHGDLWRGNVLADGDSRPWVIDPAAHGGHRETDLAMMRLFGGFGDRAFGAYDEAFPLAEGWAERVALHQLHPLLVHTVLFGGHYRDQALAVARRYA